MKVDKALIKRSMDIAIAAAGLVATAPLQLAAAAAVRTTMGKPVLFSQQRPGLHGQVFEMVKFRTMHHMDEAQGRVADADRLTKVGSVLRSTSVDELPTLWNVFRGDMSIVGPRPLLVQYLPLYSPEQARRHEMRPGLTGLAQVSGRNTVAWEDRFRLDVEYIDNWTLRLDLQILARTVVAVLRREGISADGVATVTLFRGSVARSSSYAPTTKG